MIWTFVNWLYDLMFMTRRDLLAAQLDVAALAERVRFAETKADDFERQLKDKTNELHMFVDALLIENGRTPLYMTPTALRSPRVRDDGDEPKEKDKKVELADALKRTRNPRAWSNVASSLEHQADTRINGGV